MKRKLKKEAILGLAGVLLIGTGVLWSVLDSKTDSTEVKQNPSVDVVTFTPEPTTVTVEYSPKPTVDTATIESGSYGLLTMQNDQIFALNNSEDGLDTTSTQINVEQSEGGLLKLQPLFVDNSEVGDALTIKFANGSTDSYICIDVHPVFMTDDGMIFSDVEDENIRVESVTDGDLVIISNGQASYWQLSE